MPIRQRLLGFAFASADLLLELAPDGRVAVALGSGPGKDLGLDGFQNQRLSDRLEAGGRAELGQALARLEAGRREGPIEIVMSWGEAQARRATLRMFMLPDLAPNVSCAVSYDGPVFTRAAVETPPVLTPPSFLVRARELLSDPKSRPVGDLAVAFIDIAGLAAAEADAVTGAKVVARVEAALQAASVEGATAARLSPERYALLRDRDDGRDIADDVRTAGEAEGVALDVTSIDQALPDDANPLNALRALRFAVESCLNEDALQRPDVIFSASLARTLKDAETFRTLVRERRFDMHYQPIVDLKTGAVHHFEALARFSPGSSPAATIHMAEELALIEAFDLAVAQKAVNRLRQPGSGLLKIAINLSGASLASDGYVQSLLRMTEAAPEERKRLIVEVTESGALADIEAANRRLSALRKVGIRVCIDDFGAGSASFDYLRGLSVDTVKIDGRFVRGIERDDRSRTLIAHLVELCGSLNLTTIAEMIETEDAATIVRELGVDHGQGWLFGRAEAEPRTAPPKVPSARRQGAVEAWG